VLTIKNKDDDTPWYRYPSEQNTKLVMKGREVFTFASEVLADTITLLKEKCKDKPFTKIIPHQANSRIIEYVARITGFKQDQFFINLSKFANTSSASILLALWDAYTQRWLAPGDRIALIGFGSGLTWGGVVIDWTLE
jgi:3-oxoacyl-[acyl-carrier-protein] synthase-3